MAPKPQDSGGYVNSPSDDEYEIFHDDEADLDFDEDDNPEWEDEHENDDDYMPSSSKTNANKKTSRKEKGKGKVSAPEQLYDWMDLSEAPRNLKCLPYRTANRPPKRKLIRWSDDLYIQTLLALVWILETNDASVPWNEVAAIVYPGSSGDAFKQALTKLRKKRVNEGLDVPPAPPGKDKTRKICVQELNNFLKAARTKEVPTLHPIDINSLEDGDLTTEPSATIAPQPPDSEDDGAAQVLMQIANQSATANQHSTKKRPTGVPASSPVQTQLKRTTYHTSLVVRLKLNRENLLALEQQESSKQTVKDELIERTITDGITWRMWSLSLKNQHQDEVGPHGDGIGSDHSGSTTPKASPNHTRNNSANLPLASIMEGHMFHHVPPVADHATIYSGLEEQMSIYGASGGNMATMMHQQNPDRGFAAHHMLATPNFPRHAPFQNPKSPTHQFIADPYQHDATFNGLPASSFSTEQTAVSPARAQLMSFVSRRWGDDAAASLIPGHHVQAHYDIDMRDTEPVDTDRYIHDSASSSAAQNSSFCSPTVIHNTFYPQLTTHNDSFQAPPVIQRGGFNSPSSHRSLLSESFMMLRSGQASLHQQATQSTSAPHNDFNYHSGSTRPSHGKEQSHLRNQETFDEFIDLGSPSPDQKLVTFPRSAPIDIPTKRELPYDHEESLRRHREEIVMQNYRDTRRQLC